MPTSTELAKSLKLKSHSSVRVYISALMAKGYLQKPFFGKARSLKITGKGYQYLLNNPKFPRKK